MAKDGPEKRIHPYSSPQRRSSYSQLRAAGLKLLRNRVTKLRMWLQLWDAQSGHILWESAGEVTVSTVLLSPKQTVPLDEAVQKLLFNLIQDGLLRGKTKTENYFD